MNLLLDTQAFLWLDSDQAKLSAPARQACANPENTLWLSVASAWEMQIKTALGKLRLTRPLGQIIAEQQTANGLQVLTVNLAHVLALQALPPHHKDPFDRLLIAQAKSEGWDIVSKDPEFSAYGVPVIW
ncbi:MAG: type II toxin-antitoxin system VapC family toxin [Verrucomicrobiota bacterium]